MPGPLVAAIVVLVVVALGIGLLWASRTHTLVGRVGSFRCQLDRGGSWAHGVAQYGAEHLYWWRSRSLAPRPAVRWERAGLEVVSREFHEDAHGHRTVRATVRARCGGAWREVRLAMPVDAYAGLTSWIEATPQRVGSVI